MQPALIAVDACAWPVLTRLPDSALGLVYFNRPSHGLEEGDLAALISRDDGATWQSAGIAAPHAPGANRMHIAAGVDHAGRWIVLSTGFSLRDGWLDQLQPVWRSTLAPGESTWRVERDLRLDLPERFVIPHGRILALPDGRLAATFYCSQGRGRPSRAWIACSREGGRDWTDAGEIGSGDANECCLLDLGARGLLAAARTQADHHVALYSVSGVGADWRKRLDLTLPMQHPADLIALPDGRLLATYGMRNRGLMGIGARVSADGGETWSAPAVIFQFGAEATDCGYPSTAICADGSLLTACYSDRSPLSERYHLLTLRWRSEEFFAPRPLRAISDGARMSA